MAAGQNQRGIGLHRKAGVIEVVAVIRLDQVALLHVTQQALAGFFQGFSRHRVALVPGTQQEVGDVSAQPVLFFTVSPPQTKAAVKTLHPQQALDTEFDLALAIGIRFAFKAQPLEQRRIRIQRRVQAAGGLLRAAIRVRLECADLLTQVQRRPARQTQQGFTPRRFKGLQRIFRQAPGLILEYRAVMLEHRRVRRAYTQGPFAGERRQCFPWQFEAIDRDLDRSGAETAQGLDRDLQGAALAGAQGDRLRGSARQAQLAPGLEFDLKCLRLVGEVGQVQR